MVLPSFLSWAYLAESIYHLLYLTTELCKEAVPCRSSELGPQPQRLGFKPWFSAQPLWFLEQAC